jgi:hypothetical protein
MPTVTGRKNRIFLLVLSGIYTLFKLNATAPQQQAQQKASLCTNRQPKNKTSMRWQ